MTALVWQPTQPEFAINDVLSLWCFGPGLAFLPETLKSPYLPDWYIYAGGRDVGGQIASSVRLFSGGFLVAERERDAVLGLPLSLAAFSTSRRNPPDGVQEGESPHDFLIPAPFFDGQVQEGAGVAAPTAPPAEPYKVLVLVIDNAISFTHERFRNGTSSRVEAAWIMDAVWNDDRVFFGRMWNSAEINALLSKHGSDDAALLQELGQTPAASPGRPLGAVNTSHGTQILDLVAGYGKADNEAGEVGILTVQLPANVYWDGSGSSLGFFAVAGLDRMLRYVRENLDKKTPVIAVFSYAITGGPHDGSHYIERLIDVTIDDHRKAGGKAVALIPAGNTYDERRHARAPISQGATIGWRIPPGDPSPNFLEIWVPADQTVTVNVQPPQGVAQSVTAQPAGAAAQPAVALESFDLVAGVDSVARIAVERTYAGKPTRRILVIVSATQTSRACKPGAKPRQAAPAGLWSVTVSGQSASEFRAWIHRDDLDRAFPSGVPASYIEDPVYEAGPAKRPPTQQETTIADPPGTLVKRSGSISGFAGSSKAIMVAGRRISDGRLPVYSAASDVSISPRLRAPKFSVPSDVSIVHPGFIAAGNRSGGKRWRSGTSVAAPILARWFTKLIVVDGVPVSRLSAKTRQTFHLPPPNPPAALTERQGWGYARLGAPSWVNRRRRIP